MTVKELIEKLKEYDQDLPVKVMVSEANYSQFSEHDVERSIYYSFSDENLKVNLDSELDERGEFILVFGELDERLEA